MKANNLSISIPYKGCDKSCKYCVSKMTGYMKSDFDLFRININKVKKMANTAGVTSVSITGKGEPTLNFFYIEFICQELKDYPLELQTNGLAMARNLTLVDSLVNIGIDIFAISMDKISDFEDMKPVIDRIKALNRTVRVTLNITDMLPSPTAIRFEDYINYCKKYNVDQLSFRQITVSNHTEYTNTHKWIDKHAHNDYYDRLIGQFKAQEKYNQFLESLPYGAKIYNVDGISFTYFDYCIQDTNNGEDIRSLIYMEDGHMYTNWNGVNRKF